MKKLKNYILMSFFCIFSFSLCYSVEKIISHVNLNYTKLPKSFVNNNKIKEGKIIIRNINNFREKKDGKNDFAFLGYINDYWGRFFELRASENNEINKILRDLITDALIISGYEVENSIENNYPLLDININDFICDGYGRWNGVAINLDLNLYSKGTNELLIQKKINVFTASSIWSGDFKSQVTEFHEIDDSFNISLNRILIETITFFKTKVFLNAYNGNKISSTFDNNSSAAGLTKIPADLGKNEEILFLNLERNNINKIENLNNLSNLLFLNLRMNPIKSIENLESLSNLKILILRGCNIKIIEGLDNLENLIFLDLSNCKIKKIENLENLNNLIFLTIMNYDIKLGSNRKNIKSKIKSIDKNTYNFLKDKKVIIENGLTIDEFISKNNIHIE